MKQIYSNQVRLTTEAKVKLGHILFWGSVKINEFHKYQNLTGDPCMSGKKCHYSGVKLPKRMVLGFSSYRRNCVFHVNAIGRLLE